MEKDTGNTYGNWDRECIGKMAYGWHREHV